MATDYDKIREENIRGYGEFTHHLDLLGRLYADPTHFIFELLQNAEDAGARKVKFSLYPDRLEFLNDGRPFNEADVRGICAIGKGTKGHDLTQIGKFGIGFKSVYAHTSNPQVHSGAEHFRIEHYVRPHAEQVRPVPGPWATLFVLPFDKPGVSLEQISARLQQLDTRSLLFLRNLREIEWSVRTGESGWFIRESEARGQANLVRIVGQRGARESDEEWLVFARDLPTDWYAQGASLPEEKRLRVEIAFALEKTGADRKSAIKRALSSPLVVFFPTEKPTNCGFLIQGPYRTTPTRENVPADDEWNQKLVVETADLLAEALPRLRDINLLTVGALQTLPIRIDDFPEGSMFRPFFERVRVAFKKECVLPAHDGSFVSAAGAKLARGADLRELITNDQLGELYGGQFRWLSEEITQDRTLAIRAYLIEQLGTDEIDSEAFARKLDIKFLQRQSDDWVIQFYKFLNGQRALWRSSVYSPGLLRNKPIIRLEGGSHVLPFREGGVLNAYISPSDETDLPIVKRASTADREVSEFLRALGLTEPDPVAEVIERVVPKYLTSAPNSEEAHKADVQKVLTALGQASHERKQHLIQVLKNCNFLRARNCATSVSEFKRPTETYARTEDLERYFHNSREAWLLEEPTIDEKYADMLGVIGVRSEPSSPCQRNGTGFVILRDWWGDHARGLEGFDARCAIDGLEHAMQNANVEVAEYIWNRLLPAHRRHIHGTVQRSTRQNYEPGGTQEIQETSHTGKLLVGMAWLPDASGRLHKPAELALADLPEAFNRDDNLAHWLGMRPAVPAGMDQDSLLRAAGLRPEVARLIQDNSDIIEFLATRPEMLERLRNELESATKQEDPTSTSLDYRAELAAVFARSSPQPSEVTDGTDSNGPVPNPERRRQKLQEEIQAARGREPRLTERFTRVPRKVWESKNSVARTFIEEQYRGRCQICDFTFPQRNGRWYFEGVYLVSRTRARWIDRAGNVLCLCANCSAKFVHGEVLAGDLLRQIDDFRPSEEGGPISPMLHIVLCGESTDIRFTERHLLDLQQLVKASGDLADPLIETAEKLA
ncbi:MAG: hypothetical protein WA005_06975 [Candidatus Binataceae bacterium]